MTRDNKIDGVHANASFNDNKFPVGGRIGDKPPFNGDMRSDDFGADSAGVPSVEDGVKAPLALSFEPNRFPRETGHDSLTEEEAQLS